MTRRPAPKPDPSTGPGTGLPQAWLPNQARAKAALNKAILGSCWGQLATRLSHKMPEGHLIHVNPRNTSRTCAVCGTCAPENRESQAVFECVACGHQAHADTNAALNILDRALTQHYQPEDFGGSAANQQQPARPRGPRTPPALAARGRNPTRKGREEVTCDG